MDKNKLANIRNAARAVALDPYAITIEDINHICASYGIPFHKMTEEESKEFFKIVYSYWPRWN